MFTEEAIKRFRDPKNTGELKSCNAAASAGDPECSDVIKIFIRLKDDKVEDAKFQVFGCPSATATADVFIDMIKGKAVAEALRITQKDISDALGGMPIEQLHCSSLPIEAFRKAVGSCKR
ncbi:MAG: iron-sulfur cluster assembly scaffold protein [Nanoarchaeota archaeon]|nr:iron-sulfur cluster assembly scaffold protein [Nanoarchaeota archaeon]